MGGRNGRTTLVEVAARAGVSVSTASLAFSGSGPVAAATRERVLAAAEELGYAGPDPLAASLRRGSSGVVGVVLVERLTYAFRDPFTVALLESVADVLGSRGLGLLLVPTIGTEATDPAWQLQQAPMDAALYAIGGLPDEPTLPVLRRRGIPVVGLEGPAAPDVALVAIEDRAGSAAAARHLVGLGHRRVAVASIPWRIDGTRGPLTPVRRALPGYGDVTERLAGVEDVLRPVAVWEAASSSLDEGLLAARALLAGADRPTAVVAQSDVLAAGIVRGAADLGLRVPDDVSVVGFDGLDLPWLRPHTLTTLVQPITEKGRLAGQAVLAVLAGERPPDVRLPVELRVGTTTAPPPAEVRAGNTDGADGTTGAET